MNGNTKLIYKQDNMDIFECKNDEFLFHLQEALLLVLMDKKMIDRYQSDEYLIEQRENHKKVVIR